MDQVAESMSEAARRHRRDDRHGRAIAMARRELKATVEAGSVRFRGTAIKYDIHRSPRRRKTVEISIREGMVRGCRSGCHGQGGAGPDRAEAGGMDPGEAGGRGRREAASPVGDERYGAAAGGKGPAPGGNGGRRQGDRGVGRRGSVGPAAAGTGGEGSSGLGGRGGVPVVPGSGFGASHCRGGPLVAGPGTGPEMPNPDTKPEAAVGKLLIQRHHQAQLAVDDAGAGPGGPGSGA